MTDRRNDMRRLMLGAVVAAAVVGVSAFAAVSAQGGDDPAPVVRAGATTIPTTAPTTTSTTPTTVAPAPAAAGVDISGPCDEPENRNDARCAGVVVPAPATAAARSGVDISGPCDELEHVNDPRCTGAAGAVDDDRGRGRGGDDDGSDDDRGRGRGGDDDRRGDDDGGGDDSGGRGRGRSGSDDD
jgi:hypothetical protein